jgi:hypothetical protein
MLEADRQAFGDSLAVRWRSLDSLAIWRPSQKKSTNPKDTVI